MKQKAPSLSESRIPKDMELKADGNYCPCCSSRMVSDFDEKVGVFWTCPNCEYAFTFREPPEIQPTASPASGAQLPDDTVASSGLHEPESLSSLARQCAEKVWVDEQAITELASVIKSVFTGSDLYRQGERAGIEAAAKLVNERRFEGETDLRSIVASIRALLPAGEKSGE